MTMIATRRAMIAGTGALALSACVGGGLGGIGGLPNLAGVLKDLLGISAERAFARLLQDDGFLNDSLARLDLPEQFSGAGGIAATLLRTPAVQNELLERVNDAAGIAARAAEPIVDDAISRLTFADASAVLRGGPHAATGVLETRIGESLGERLIPLALEGLGIGGGSDLIVRALSAVSGFDVNALAGDVGRGASRSIFRAIGREEAAIRADPRSTNNAALIAALAALG